MAPSQLRLGQRTVEVTNQDKLYFPDHGITKGQLVDYYRRAAAVMMRYLRDRALTLHRYPNGIDGDDFYQQQRPDHFPDWVNGVELPRRGGGSVVHTVVDSAAALVVVANSGCITPHLWLSRVDRPEHPDQLVFDLDPAPGAGFDAVRRAAARLRELLEQLELTALVKTTGSRGLHVVVPIRRRHDFDETRDFCRRVAELLASSDPDGLTTEPRTERRRGRLYLDVQRNAYGQHAVAPYAVRALPGAPVATPLEWSELDASDLGPRRYTVKNIFRRLGQRDDPWIGAWRKARSLDRPRAALERLESRGDR